jgi:DNA (cytosine-5)-methyltransferase 1
MNYYNEHDPKAAAWLRELINAGLIPNGDVDERSIVDLQPNELRHYTQCHFFAGIGGWSLALQLAGWSADRPVWTGSCPCQPFSAAGKGLAQADERHLWPTFFNLIRECRPDAVFGEQVASAIGKGWLDGIQADLESEDYACGATVLGAHSVSAPHIRQRLYWVADSESIRPQEHGKRELWRASRKQSETSGLADSDSRRCKQRDERFGSVSESNEDSAIDGLANSVSERGCSRDSQGQYANDAIPSGHVDWNRSQRIDCRDGRQRRIPLEPAFFPLANGIPARVVRLRGYGNAIVPQVAAAFIKAFLDSQTTCLAVSAK